MKSLSLVAALLLAMTAVKTQDTHGVISGTVTKIDNAAKTVTIKTKTGTEVVAGAEHTAVAIKLVGNTTVKVAEGTVDAVDAGAKTVAVKTKDGSVVVFNSGEDSVISAGGAMKQGAHVTIHYTEDGARKIAHALSTI